MAEFDWNDVRAFLAVARSGRLTAAAARLGVDHSTLSRDVVAKHQLSGRVAAVLFSPVHGVTDSSELAAWILADRLDVRLQLQAHKFIWGADVRGV